MAKVTNQTVPPSLADLFSSVISSTDWYNRSDTIAKLNPAIRRPSTVDDRSELLRRAWQAAEDYADNEIGMIDTSARRAFVEARLAEILTAGFTTDWWYSVPIANTKVRVRVPFCYSNPGAVAPAYQDPARIAATCQYNAWSSQYNVPAAHSDLPTPSLGWRGEVQSGQWKDLWCTSLLYDAFASYVVSHKTKRPMWAVVDYSIDLSASFRGNRLWGSLNIGCQAASSYTTSDDYNSKLHNTVSPEHRFYIPINPPATPWSQTITGRSIIDLHGLQYRPKTSNYYHMLIHITPVPAWGRYFARNDFVQCWVDTSIAVWQAKGFSS
jgi:hypothetical protein